ncbi:hypothetical protein MMC22_003114 [Lobaria immixta]|nr:hypothetical protein [Lobaria immixta]
MAQSTKIDITLTNNHETPALFLFDFEANGKDDRWKTITNQWGLFSRRQHDDIHGRMRYFHEYFLAAGLPAEDVVLVNRIELNEPEIFAEDAIKKGAATFCFYVRTGLTEIWNANADTHASRLANVAAALTPEEFEAKGEKVELPECYKEYEEVFSEDNAYTLGQSDGS